MTVNIESAAKLPGEFAILATVVDDLSSDETRLVYADWLEDQGDDLRAKFIRSYVRAYGSMRFADFPAEDNVSETWREMIGSRHVRALAKAGVKQRPDSLMKLARPSITYRKEATPLGVHSHNYSRYNGNDDFPAGSTKSYGVADLEVGARWPVSSDCQAVMAGNGAGRDGHCDPNRPCGFDLQFNLSDFETLQAGRGFPERGLLSFFTCETFDTYEPPTMSPPTPLVMVVQTVQSYSLRLMSSYNAFHPQTH